MRSIKASNSNSFIKLNPKSKQQYYNFNGKYKTYLDVKSSKDIHKFFNLSKTPKNIFASNDVLLRNYDISKLK